MSVQPAPAPIALPDGSAPPQSLTVVDVPGAGRAAGRIYGEACRALIRNRHARVMRRLREQRGLDADEVYRRALPYRAATASRTPCAERRASGPRTSSRSPARSPRSAPAASGSRSGRHTWRRTALTRSHMLGRHAIAALRENGDNKSIGLALYD